ncbi:coiled-coil-helix-coiled-coil-helix domain containing 3a isoform X1 [Tachysurus fulvidraco]|uniref:coiled-coil-helix-coiled-coil-helix domain containing 3a isoform X1 n=1 Tax=Tachysurus fulvidraco TaxID=1234273 RepID=UPI001FEFFCCA|nr:coiled-coil-helix-coiled-coil-helix domain containing 3a isoform X1 [Tachysurus fulvidraco]
MGGSNSTRRVSFESDEDDNVTVVKGVRLSESVINRMREPSKPPSRSSPPSEARPKPAASPPSAPAADLGTPLNDPATTQADPAAPVAPSSPSLPSPALEEPVTPPTAVDESELRRKITEEVQKGLEEERSKTQYELHQWLEKERARVKAQARSDVQAHVQGEVSRILASERAAALDSAQKAVLSERLTAEEERLRTKLLAKQLEERDQQLRKQDAFYREQLNKLEERSTQFYKVINEDYHKAADEVNSKFRRYEISPVCADLQEQILKCYRENAGKTLLCSNIASLYMQCVNSAKQKKLRTGG